MLKFAYIFACFLLPNFKLKIFFPLQHDPVNVQVVNQQALDGKYLSSVVSRGRP